MSSRSVRHPLRLACAAASLAALTCALPAPAFAAASVSEARQGATSRAGRFGLDTVRQAAQELARHAYTPPDSKLPKPLRGLTYDQYRDIRFQARRALWHDGRARFQVQLFHLGSYFETPVEVNLVEGGRVVPVHYDPAMFDFGKNSLDTSSLGDLGFAGFRVHYPLNTPRYADELVAFLGASYFRALGRSAVYGASARGLAIDTGVPSGEEFPAFRTFWIERPAPGAREITIYALLDSRSMTGAYRFVVHPGDTTVMDVTATLFARAQVQRLGIAPLTSMFLCGESSGGCRDDFRPEVHDSDGLVLWLASGERLFRPLENPTRLTFSSFQAPSLKGFGLVQRDRAFTSYEDLESRFERRPDVLVEPVGDWGDGQVSLLELPTPEEIHDNVTAFWTPATPLAKGASLTLAYRLSWGLSIPQLEHPGRVLATHTGAGSSVGHRRFVVDFADGVAAPRGAEPEPVVNASHGRIVEPVAQRNDVTGGWRVAFELAPDGDEPVELRCFARAGSATLTETWSMLWTPQPPPTAQR